MNMLNSIGLDIDGVLADFICAWNKIYPDVPAIPNKYDYDPNMGKRFRAMKEAGTLDDFFLSLNPLIHPKNIGFEPKGYVTARPVDTAVTELWLHKNGFPRKPVKTIPWGGNKIEVMKELGIKICNILW